MGLLCQWVTYKLQHTDYNTSPRSVLRRRRREAFLTFLFVVGTTILSARYTLLQRNTIQFNKVHVRKTFLMILDKIKWVHTNRIRVKLTIRNVFFILLSSILRRNKGTYDKIWNCDWLLKWIFWSVPIICSLSFPSNVKRVDNSKIVRIHQLWYKNNILILWAFRYVGSKAGLYFLCWIGIHVSSGFLALYGSIFDRLSGKRYMINVTWAWYIQISITHCLIFSSLCAISASFSSIIPLIEIIIFFLSLQISPMLQTIHHDLKS